LLKNRQKNRIRSEILILKENFNANCDEIFEKELQLSEIIEIELKEELSQIKNFERLNDEKITPYFLKLAKTPTQSESLETICDDDGVPFDSNAERSSHIHRYYKSLYKKPLQLTNGPDISTEGFLGECSNEPDVINSKISDEEKNNLDRPLSIVELDRAIKNAKKNTAPGADGISNRFILKIGIFSGHRYLSTQINVMTMDDSLIVSGVQTYAEFQKKVTVRKYKIGAPSVF
jgi:hypothetical protein